MHGFLYCRSGSMLCASYPCSDNVASECIRILSQAEMGMVASPFYTLESQVNKISRKHSNCEIGTPPAQLQQNGRAGSRKASHHRRVRASSCVLRQAQQGSLELAINKLPGGVYLSPRNSMTSLEVLKGPAEQGLASELTRLLVSEAMKREGDDYASVRSTQGTQSVYGQDAVDAPTDTTELLKGSGDATHDAQSGRKDSQADSGLYDDTDQYMAEQALLNKPSPSLNQTKKLEQRQGSRPSLRDNAGYKLAPGLSPSESMHRKRAISDPILTCGFSTKTHDAVLFLEHLGADYVKVLSKDPAFATFDLAVFRRLISVLYCHGLERKDLGKIINLCPQVLHLDPETDFKHLQKFLFTEVGLPPEDFCKVVKRCPRILACSVNKQLRPALNFLCLFGFTRIGQVISINPALLLCSVSKRLIPHLIFLEELGFSYEAAVIMVLRFPAMFRYSAKENLQPKFDYLVNEMGRNPCELITFPQYFGFNLESRIKQRHRWAVQHKVHMPLSHLLKLPEDKLKSMVHTLNQGTFKDELSMHPTIDVPYHDCALERLTSIHSCNTETPLLVGA